MISLTLVQLSLFELALTARGKTRLPTSRVLFHMRVKYNTTSIRCGSPSLDWKYHLIDMNVIAVMYLHSVDSLEGARANEQPHYKCDEVCEVS